MFMPSSAAHIQEWRLFEGGSWSNKYRILYLVVLLVLAICGPKRTNWLLHHFPWTQAKLQDSNFPSVVRLDGWRLWSFIPYGMPHCLWYLSLPHRGSRGNHSGTEDHESGIGQSLPCSPSNEEISKEAYGNIAMSLCGELKKGKVAQGMSSWSDCRTFHSY